MVQLDMHSDLIICVMVIGCMEAAQKWALHGYLGKAPDYRDAMHVSAFGVLEQGNSQI